MRKLLLPYVGAGAVAVCLFRNQAAIGKGDVLFVHSKGNPLRMVFLRSVYGRKPGRIGLGFALGPDLGRLLRIPVARVNEIQSFFSRNRLAATRFEPVRHGGVTD